jgi:hypothetical protein
MDMENPETAPSVVRRILPWLGLLLAGAAIFDGAVFYSRWSSSRELERAKAARETEDARRFLKIAGGNDLKILDFYASPGAVRPGQYASLCYGVKEATSVRLEPATEEVWPSLSRCLQVSPRRDTEYKLTAEDAGGHSVSQSVVIRVLH